MPPSVPISDLIPPERFKEWSVLAPYSMSIYPDTISLEWRFNSLGEPIQRLRLLIQASCCDECTPVLHLTTFVRRQNRDWLPRNHFSAIGDFGRQSYVNEDCPDPEPPEPRQCPPPYSPGDFPYQDLRLQLEQWFSLSENITGSLDDFIFLSNSPDNCQDCSTPTRCPSPGWYIEYFDEFGESLGYEIFEPAPSNVYGDRTSDRCNAVFRNRNLLATKMGDFYESILGSRPDFINRTCFALFVEYDDPYYYAEADVYYCPRECPAGQSYDSTLNKCVPDCAPGFQLNEDGTSCVPIAENSFPEGPLRVGLWVIPNSGFNQYSATPPDCTIQNVASGINVTPYEHIAFQGYYPAEDPFPVIPNVQTTNFRNDPLVFNCPGHPSFSSFITVNAGANRLNNDFTTFTYFPGVNFLQGVSDVVTGQPDPDAPDFWTERFSSFSMEARLTDQNFNLVATVPFGNFAGGQPEPSGVSSTLPPGSCNLCITITVSVSVNIPFDVFRVLPSGRRQRLAQLVASTPSISYQLPPFCTLISEELASNPTALNIAAEVTSAGLSLVVDAGVDGLLSAAFPGWGSFIALYSEVSTDVNYTVEC